MSVWALVRNKSGSLRLGEQGKQSSQLWRSKVSGKKDVFRQNDAMIFIILVFPILLPNPVAEFF